MFLFRNYKKTEKTNFDSLLRPTTDDVDVLKRELITVQQRMNDMSLEKEQQVDALRRILFEMSVNKKEFSLANCFHFT